MSDFSSSTALYLMRQTAPFVMSRLAITFRIAVAYVLATGVEAGLGYGIDGFQESDRRLAASAYGSAGGFALTAAALNFLRVYALLLVKWVSPKRNEAVL